jgi:hypothetical protein
MLGFVALVCVFLYFYCCTVGCLCQGLQEAGVMQSWYNRLVSCWGGGKGSVVTGWMRIGGKDESGEESGEKGQKE